MSSVPTIVDVAAYLGIAPTTPGLDLAHAAALESQAARCDVSSYTDSLRLAAIRRAARTYAAQNHPLGTVDAGELGPLRITRWDAEIETAEADYRLPPLSGPYPAPPVVPL